MSESRNQALNLALMWHRQENKSLSDDQILETAEKFKGFLEGKS